MSHILLYPRFIYKLASLRPCVSIANAIRCPPLHPHVRCILASVYGALSAGETLPLDSVLQQYSHTVYRVGACQLFPSDRCDARRVFDVHVERFFCDLFRCAARVAGARLSRFDLHHAHMFFDSQSQLWGLLFHAKEYPAYCDETFPYRLGFCQMGSDVLLKRVEDMQRRCVLWVYGVEWLMLLQSYSRLPFGTVYEAEFGVPLADMYFFESRFGQKADGLNRGLHVVPYSGRCDV